ncbi:MAG TPA: preprotein translocase subunit SecE [Solirubrobacteraceae bacterium]|nr:preprotein translocase subunit SecE [Solirubrobacteraceae bacterium]
MARDRKRAKQRRERRGGALAGRNRPEAGAAPTEQPLHRADVPGALDHASGEVEEFDAALVRGADGVEADSDALEADADALDPADELDAADDALQAPEAGSGRGADGGGPGGVAVAERPSGAPLRGGNRAIGFLRASWAELQRVQWPDRRQVTQATAVVLGFVAIAGAYLGAADFVAKEVVEFILG